MLESQPEEMIRYATVSFSSILPDIWMTVLMGCCRWGVVGGVLIVGYCGWAAVGGVFLVGC